MNNITKKFHAFMFSLPFLFFLSVLLFGLMGSSKEVFYCEDRAFYTHFFASDILGYASIGLYLVFTLFDGIFRNNRKIFLIVVMVAYLGVNIPAFSLGQRYFHNYEKEWSYFLSRRNQERYTKMIEDLSQKIEEAPNLYLYKKRASLFFEMKEYEKTIEDASKALLLDNNDLDSLRFLGIANFFLGNDKEALKAYEKFIKIAVKEDYLKSSRGSVVTKEIALKYSYLLDWVNNDEREHKTVVIPEYASYDGVFEEGRPLEGEKAYCRDNKEAEYFISRDFRGSFWYVNVKCSRETGKVKSIGLEFNFHNKKKFNEEHEKRVDEVLGYIGRK